MSEEPRIVDPERTLVMTADMLAAAVPAAWHAHFLLAVDGPQPGLRVQVTGQPVRIGRHADCDIRVSDHQVSSLHCQVTLPPQGDSLLVQDLQSTNGTFIQGARVTGAATLGPGALLRIGAQSFRHVCLTAAEAAIIMDRERDLEKARRYVEALLPAPIATGPVRTDWHFVPSAQLGGDAFGYHQLDEHVFSGYLMDICGHGAGAAMHSVSVMNVMRQRALPHTDFLEPAQVLASLNAMFQMESHGGMYFSMWYGVYDVRTGRLRYASAGHHASYLVSADRRTMTPLATRNLVIGAAPGARFVSAETQVEPGCSLYVFSDGVFEVTTADGTQWGLQDFLPLLQAPAAPHGEEALRLYRQVRAIARPGPLEDDFTALIVTLLSPGAPSVG